MTSFLESYQAPVEQADEEGEEVGDRRKKPIEPLPAVSWLECERKIANLSCVGMNNHGFRSGGPL